MNYFAQQKWLKWTVALLIMSNLAILSLLVFKPQHHKPPMHHDGPKDFIIKELELNDEQIEQYELLVDVHRALMDDLGHQKRRQKAQYFINLGQEPTEKADEELQGILDIQKEQEVITYEHFEKLRRMLTPDQQQKFDEIIEKAIDMIMGPPKHPHEGPPLHH